MKCFQLRWIAWLIALIATGTVDAQPYSLSGHITDVGTGLPISGANVSGSGEQFYPLLSFQTTTDSAGYYLVTVSPANYSVSATADGYLYGGKSADLSAGPAVVDIALSKPGTITGVVVRHSDATPIANLTVSLDQQVDTLGAGNAVTTADGSFSIGRLYPGDYAACIQSASFGYLNQCYDDLNASASGIVSYTKIHVDSGQAVTGVNFHLINGVAISGTLRDANTQHALAFAKAGIILRSSLGDLVGGSDIIMTGAAGQYTLPGIPPGEDYYLEAWIPHVDGTPNTYYSPTLHGGGLCADTYSPCPITAANLFSVPAGGVSSIDVSLNPGHTVSGYVTDARTGVPLPGVTVKSCEQTNSIVDMTATTITNGDGLFWLTHVIGSYTSIETSNTQGYIDVVWPGWPISPDIKCVEFNDFALPFSDPAQQLSGVDMQLSNGPVIAGRVLAREFAKALSAQVEIWSYAGNSSTLIWQGATDEYGNFITGILPSGTYYALAYLDQGSPCQQYSDQPCGSSGNAPAVIPGLATPISINGGVFQTIILELPVEIFSSRFE